MRSSAAASGFVVFLLSLSVIQGESDLGVTYSPTYICALKGSTVEIRCSFTYPSRLNGLDTTVERTFWFIKLQDEQPVDLRADVNFAGRVQHHCAEKNCTLRITDLRDSDSAVYKFHFSTNQEGGNYTGADGVHLIVTGFQVKMFSSRLCGFHYCTQSMLVCISKCIQQNGMSYIWYKNEEEVEAKSYLYEDYFYSEDSVSCTGRGYEESPAPSVCGYGNSCSRVSYDTRRICRFSGSSVNISCSYNIYQYVVGSKFWFRPDLRRHDLSESSQYAGRVQVQTEGGHSTLRINDLKKTDSAEYRFLFKTRTLEWPSILPGTFLTVIDPDLQVQVILSPTGPRLICYSSCLQDRPSSFVWFNNDTKIMGETSASYSGYIDPAGFYSCAYNGYYSAAVYAPTSPSAEMIPTGDVMEDSSLTLSCSTDANPAAKYTWFKKNQSGVSHEAQLVFRSIQASDSGEYYCTAKNELWSRTSKSVIVDVKYGPKATTLSVSPSGELVEGRSVTLTCSADANPAANYTWYKEKQTLHAGPERFYNFSSISSEDRGTYYCKSENLYGQNDSTSVFLDVLYAPKLPSVSVSPSAEIDEGSSVNLTCSSDANPAANYTWYKEHEEEPTASGQIFTISIFTSEHSGNYYCEARNRRGRRTSASHLIVMAGSESSAAIGGISALLLVIMFLTVFFWIRRKKSNSQQIKREARSDTTAQPYRGPVQDNLSAAEQRHPEEQQDDLHYASIRFLQREADVLYSNIRPVRSHRRDQGEDGEDRVEYAAVKINYACRPPGRSEEHQDPEEDPCPLYSLLTPVRAQAC